MPDITQRDPKATTATTTPNTKWLNGNVSIRLLVQTDGALLFQFQQPPLNVEVPLEGSILFLDHPPQGVDLGVGRLVRLLDSHQGAIKRATQ